jgi:hypothetical protein
VAARKPKCKICSSKAEVAGLCRPCYQSAYYWSKKTPGQMVKRMNDLERYERRMDYMLGNVRAHKKRRSG